MNGNFRQTKQSLPHGYIVQVHIQVLLLLIVYVANDTSLDGLIVHGSLNLMFPVQILVNIGQRDEVSIFGYSFVLVVAAHRVK